MTLELMDEFFEPLGYFDIEFYVKLHFMIKFLKFGVNFSQQLDILALRVLKVFCFYSLEVDGDFLMK